MNAIQVTTFTNGKWRQNCYLVSNTQRQVLIIDPGSDSDAISGLVAELELKPIAILNTHAHYDHIGAVVELLKKYEISFYLHNADAKLLKQANLYKLLFEAKNSILVPALDEDFANLPSDVVLGDFKIGVIHTPGHTAGSVCLIIDNHLFSGDTLLPNGPGRTDLPGGDRTALSKSLGTLRELPQDLVVYPGHGKPFTLQEFWKKEPWPKSSE
jgi:glyoxylase-like metal-dependent hydrolase (beta-lactamase superfamily II)